jgi:hypothetical protein
VSGCESNQVNRHATTPQPRTATLRARSGPIATFHCHRSFEPTAALITSRTHSHLPDISKVLKIYRLRFRRLAVVVRAPATRHNLLHHLDPLHTQLWSRASRYRNGFHDPALSVVDAKSNVIKSHHACRASNETLPTNAGGR